MGLKRRRLALSCVDCRKRKVKCGRETPACVRCIRGGHGDSCVYVQYDDGSQPGLSTPTEESPEDQRQASPAQSWTEEAQHWQKTSAGTSASIPANGLLKRRPPQRTVEDLQERVFELETYVKAAGSRPHSSEQYLGMGHPVGPGASSHRDGLQDFDRSLLKGKSFKTQYFGPSHAASLLLQFEELSTFVADILKRIPYFDKVREDWKDARKVNSSASDVEKERGLREFAAMLPIKNRTDALLSQYFETFETTYRVLHVPTFQVRYDQFWTDPSETDVHFVVQLLLICASMNCVVSSIHDGFVGRSSVARENAIRWIDTSEIWLRNHSHKHTTLEYFQSQVLLVVAKRLTCHKVKREWTVAGNLLRLAMAAGFHREPTFLSNKINPYDQEMRRRLWYTILEIELQASSDRGMRASITAEDWDTLPPLNVHDEDFNSTTLTMPTTLPLTTFTRTSALCSAGSHVTLRLEMLNAINSISSPLSQSVALSYDDRIRTILDILPTYSSSSSTTTTFPAAFSKLLLVSFLLLIHQPLVTASSSSRQFYSRCSRRESALTILSIYTSPAVLTLPQRLVLVNSRDEDLRACLSLCHDLAESAHSNSPAASLVYDSALPLQYLTDMIDLFGTRLKQLGQGFHSYWIGSSALGLASAKMDPDQPTEKYAQEAADRVTKLHDEIMALQRPGYDGHVFMGKLQQHAKKQGLQSEGRGNGLGNVLNDDGIVTVRNEGFVVDGFTPPDPFNATLFDFNDFDLWNMGYVMGDMPMTGYNGGEAP